MEYSDPRDADDARYNLDGRDVDGSRIIVEFAKGIPRGSDGSREREYMGRGPASGTGRCFNCGIDGHWARDCKAGDWKNKCYLCGERGHIEWNCQNSPRSLRRERSYSRSPSPRRGRARSRSYSRSRSQSYSLTADLGPDLFLNLPEGAAGSVMRDQGASATAKAPGDLSPEKQRKWIAAPHLMATRAPSDPFPQKQRINGDSPMGRAVSRSPSDGYHSPVANGRSPSPRGKDGSRSPTNKGSPSPTRGSLISKGLPTGRQGQIAAPVLYIVRDSY